MGVPFDHSVMMQQFRNLIVAAPEGPRLELGVHRGDSLAVMMGHPNVTIGVDSFEGMGDPSPHDIHPDGRNEYPRGRLKVDFNAVAKRFDGYKNVMLVKGWVPTILQDIPCAPFAFVHVDLDHYEPTKAALEWCWTRMMPGGILCCDDWFPNRTNMFASKAIAEMEQMKRPLDGEIMRKAVWRF